MISFCSLLQLRMAVPTCGIAVKKMFSATERFCNENLSLCCSRFAQRCEIQYCYKARLLMSPPIT